MHGRKIMAAPVWQTTAAVIGCVGMITVFSTHALAAGSFGGGWICTADCNCAPQSPDKSAKITEASGSVTFQNECGDKSKGNRVSANTVRASDWKNIVAKISKDGNTINWSNGSVWIRDERLTEANCFDIHNNDNFVSKTAKELMGSQEAQALGVAICTFYSGDAGTCLKGISAGAGIVNQLTAHDGSDYHGIFRAEVGYEICRAHFVSNDWSATGDATFNAGILRTSRDNGLGWYGSLKVGDGQNHWFTTKVIIEQVPAGQVQRYSCPASGTLEWLCKGGDCSHLEAGAKVGLPANSKQKKCTDIFN